MRASRYVRGAWAARLEVEVGHHTTFRRRTGTKPSPPPFFYLARPGPGGDDAFPSRPRRPTTRLAWPLPRPACFTRRLPPPGLPIGRGDGGYLEASRTRPGPSRRPRPGGSRGLRAGRAAKTTASCLSRPGRGGGRGPPLSRLAGAPLHLASLAGRLLRAIAAGNGVYSHGWVRRTRFFFTLWGGRGPGVGLRRSASSPLFLALCSRRRLHSPSWAR